MPIWFYEGDPDSRIAQAVTELEERCKRKNPDTYETDIRALSINFRSSTARKRKIPKSAIACAPTGLRRSLHLISSTFSMKCGWCGVKLEFAGAISSARCIPTTPPSLQNIKLSHCQALIHTPTWGVFFICKIF